MGRTPLVADPRHHASLMKTTMILCTATVNRARRSREGRFDAIEKVIRPLQRLRRRGPLSGVHLSQLTRRCSCDVGSSFLGCWSLVDFSPPACSSHHPSASGSARSWRSVESRSWLLVAVTRCMTIGSAAAASAHGGATWKAAAAVRVTFPNAGPSERRCLLARFASCGAWPKQLPMPLGDEFDGAVDNSYRGLIVNRVPGP